MHIVGLEIENFGRIKAVQLDTAGMNTVVLSGRNGQGKTAVMNAIWAAIGGRAGSTEKPVREGAEEARVLVDLGDMTVERIWRNDTTALKVRSAEGAEFKSAQTMLDSFIGRFSFDPLAFTLLKGREQREALLALVELGIDLDSLQAERDALFNQRTTAGQQRKALGTPVVDETLPPEEVAAPDLIARIVDEQNAEAQRLQIARGIEDADAKLASYASQRAAIEQQIAELTADRAEKIARQAELGESTGAVAELTAELEGIEAKNAAIRANQDARNVLAEGERLDKLRDDLTAGIAALDKRKDDALAAAKFPVPGLGFDADGVTLNGIPFGQASTAEKIRTSMGIAIAADPKLRIVRILDGSLLDDDSMAVVSEVAAANDFQVWVERVSNGDGIGFVIEAGELAA